MQPTPNVLGAPANGLLGRWGGSKYNRLNPTAIANLAAWYDVSSDASTTSDLLRIDASNRVSLLADRSGNSGTNCLCLNGVAGNYASFSATTAPGTGDFSISARLRVTSFSAESAVISGTVNSCRFRITTGGLLYVGVAGGASLGNSSSGISLFQDAVVGYTRSGTTGTYYVNGVAAGTVTDSNNYTLGFNNVGIVAASSTPAFANFFWARVYSAALTGPEMLADAGGSVQANNVFNCDFTSFTKLAASGSAITGGTVTINSSGDLGARISGERDLVQLTASKQPIYLPWSGTNYGWLNGVSGNYFSTPDSASVSVTGPIDIRADAQFNDWSAASAQYFVSKAIIDGQSSYDFAVNTTGNLVFRYSPTGTFAALRSAASTAAVAFADFARGQVRATYDSATGTVQFFTRTDGNLTANTGWTQLGTNVALTAGTIFDGTDQLRVGQSVSVGNPTGSIFRAQVLNGINGTVVADFDPSRYTSGTTFTASTGETWTLNGGATIVTATSLYFDGTDDYMKAAAFSLSQPETVYFVGSQVSWTNNDVLYDGNASFSMYAEQLTSSPQVAIFANAPSLASVSPPLGSNVAFSSVFNGASSSIRLNRQSAVTGATGTAAANGFTLAARGATGGNNGNIRTNEIAIYAAAHDTATVDRWALYAASKWRISGV